MITHNRATPWFLGVALLLLFLTAGSSQLTDAGAIAAIIAASLVFLGMLYGGYGTLRRWWILRNPIEVSYFIPKRSYEKRTFDGASDFEVGVQSMTIGEGIYVVMHRIIPKIDLTEYDMTVKFIGTPCPRVLHVRNPYIVDDPDDDIEKAIYYRDWHGSVHKRSVDRLNRYRKGEPWYIGHAIEAPLQYDGEMVLTWKFHERSPYERKFKFVVTDDPEKVGVPFMKEDCIYEV